MKNKFVLSIIVILITLFPSFYFGRLSAAVAEEEVPYNSYVEVIAMFPHNTSSQSGTAFRFVSGDCVVEWVPDLSREKDRQFISSVRPGASYRFLCDPRPDLITTGLKNYWLYRYYGGLQWTPESVTTPIVLPPPTPLNK